MAKIIIYVFLRASVHQVLLEETYRPFPGELGGVFIIAGRRIVVETVVGIGIDVGFVFLAMFFQRSFIGRPTFVNAGVQFAKMQQQRRLNLWHLFVRRLSSIKRNGGPQIRYFDRHHIGDPAAETKTYHAHLTSAFGMGSEMIKGSDEILQHFVAIPLTLHGSTFIIRPGIATQRPKRIGGRGK